MSPMGPMMSACGGGFIWLFVVPVLLLALGVVAVTVRSGGVATTRPRPRAPEAILRERYAEGELTRQQYRDALEDVLKDRYVRGELEVDAYETRLRQLFEEPRTSTPAGMGSVGEVAASRAATRDAEGE